MAISTQVPGASGGGGGGTSTPVAIENVDFASGTSYQTFYFGATGTTGGVQAADVVCNTTFTASRMAVYAENAGTGNYCGMAIYDASNVLLAETALFTAVAGLNIQNLQSTVDLTIGTQYRLAVFLSENAFTFLALTGRIAAFGSVDFGITGSFPDPLPAAGTSTVRIWTWVGPA